MKNKKGDIEWDTVAYWVLGIVVLIIAVGGIVLLSGKGTGAIEFIKNLFRFRS